MAKEGYSPESLKALGMYETIGLGGKYKLQIGNELCMRIGREPRTIVYMIDRMMLWGHVEVYEEKGQNKFVRLTMEGKKILDKDEKRM